MSVRSPPTGTLSAGAMTTTGRCRGRRRVAVIFKSQPVGSMYVRSDQATSTLSAGAATGGSGAAGYLEGFNCGVVSDWGFSCVITGNP